MIEPKVAIDAEGSREIIEAARDVFSPVSETLGLLGDNIRFFRARAAIRNFARAKELADEAGLTLNAPPLKFLAPYIEQGSIEEETNTTLQDMWARLLVSAGHDYDDKQVRFVRILSEMSETEARLLKALVDPENSQDKKIWGFADDAEYLWEDSPVRSVFKAVETISSVDDVYLHIVNEMSGAGSLVYELIVWDKTSEDQYSITNPSHPGRSFPEAAFYGLASAGLIVHNRRFHAETPRFDIALYGSYVTSFGFSFFETVSSKNSSEQES